MAGPHTWLGNAAGTWDLNTNWSTGLVPDTGEAVIFDGNALFDVLTDPIATKNEFSSVLVTGDFAKNFGSAAATIDLDAAAATAVLIIDASSVPTYFKISGLFTAATILDAGSTATACVLLGTYTTLNLVKGTITIVTAAILTTLNINYSTNQASDVNLTIPAGCTITNVYQRGGVVACASALGTRLDLDSGTFTHSDGNVGTLSVRGGTYYWNCVGDTITKANLFGGTFDGRNNGSAKTVTDLDIWPGATAYFNNGGRNITMTNAAKYYGGTMVMDKGSGFKINQ